MLRRNGWLSFGLICLGLCVRIAAYPFISDDVRISVQPWYDEFCKHGFSMLATDFSNYSPPYLYLLWLSSIVLVLSTLCSRLSSPARFATSGSVARQQYW